MNIFVIRHGETTGDIEDRYGGDYDDHLSPKGEAQSQALALELKNKGLEVIFTSPLLRAQETTEFISRETGAPLVILPDLKERNQYGILTGMKKEKALLEHPAEVELLKSRYNTIEGAESYEDFSARIARAFKKATTEHTHAAIGMLWHGGPMRVLFRDVLTMGELKEIGDCSWVHLEKTQAGFTIRDSKGIVFDFYGFA